MEKERRTKTLMIVVLLIVITGLTIAFAALSSIVKINGATIVSPFDMNYSFADTWHQLPGYHAVEGIYDGKSTNAENTTMSLSDDKKTLLISTKLRLPGDYTKMYAVIENNGQISGIVQNVEYGTPVCTSDTGNKADEKLVCDNISYTDVTIVEADKADGGEFELKPGLELTASSYMMGFNITLSGDMTSVPSSNVSVSNLSIKLNVVQK